TTLTVQPGAIVKFAPATGMEVYGALDVNGSSASPVIFTSTPDDNAGGDTNGDGASSGSPGGWLGIRFWGSADASTLDHLIERYGGSFGWSGIILNTADIAMSDCTVERFLESGMVLQAGTLPTVQRCDFRDNGYYAVTGVPLDAVPGFGDDAASGNG